MSFAVCARELREQCRPPEGHYYMYCATTIDGDELKFESFKGKPVLITNVACK